MPISQTAPSRFRLAPAPSLRPAPAYLRPFHIIHNRAATAVTMKAQFQQANNANPQIISATPPLRRGPTHLPPAAGRKRIARNARAGRPVGKRPSLHLRQHGSLARRPRA